MSWLTTLRQAGHSHVNAPALGIACMVASGLVVTVNNAAIKAVSPELPTSEVIFLRGVFSLLVLAGSFRSAARLRELRVRNPWSHIQFSALQIVAMFTFVWSLRVLPLAEVSAVMFLGPIFVAAMASFMLRERVGLARWIVISAAFAGVLVMFRPQPGISSWLVLVPLLSALVSALRDVLTRRIAAADTTFSLIVYSNMAVMLSGLVTAPIDGWAIPGNVDLLLLFACGASFTLSNYLSYEAFRFGEAAIVAPFRYISLLWALFAGYAFFAEIPDLWMLVGSVLIVGAGLTLLRLSTGKSRPSTPAS